MKFTKYHKHGAYHWNMYEDKNTKYHRHVNRMMEWMKEGPILDLGAGDGKLTSMLPNCIGIDNEPEAVRLAREKGSPVTLGDAYNIPFRDKSFRSVFAGDVLEHLEHPGKALKEISRVLTHYFYIASPIKGMQNDPFHYKEWTEEELIELVKPYGFRLVEPILTVKKDKRIYGKFKL